MKDRGFTLAELLVSVAIIIIISGASLVSFRFGEKIWALKRASQKAVQDIRRVQNMALSSPKVDSTEVCGYGVYYSTATNTQYILFGDKPTTPGDCTTANNSYDSGSDPVIETIIIETGVRILNLETFTNGTPTSVSSFSIVFIPPDPTTKFSGGASITKNRITLCLTTDTSKTKKATINNKGNVDIE